MKIEITVSERVVYHRFIDIPKSEYEETKKQLSQLKGSALDRFSDRLADKYLKRTDEDWLDASELEIEKFRPV